MLHPIAAGSHRKQGRSSSRPATETPVLFSEESRVRRIEAVEHGRIEEFFREEGCDSALIAGETGAVLSAFPERSCQTCITSPPYWSLRDYNIPGQIGLEDSVHAYIENLTRVFGQVRRILKDNGTLWLNIGDSYTSGGRTWRATDKKNPVRAMSVRPPTPDGLKSKDLIGVPWLLAFALQKEGWYLPTSYGISRTVSPRA